MRSANIDAQLNTVSDAIKNLKAIDKQLTRQGCTLTHLHIKKGTKKMYTLDPVDAQGKRKYTYIGVNPEKQQAVRDAIARYHRRAEVRDEIARLERELSFMKGQVKELSADCRDLATEAKQLARNYC